MSRSRRRSMVGIAAWGLVLMLLLPTPAGAHDQTTYYPRRWVDTTQDWFFTASFPTGEKRARVRDGVAAWNGRSQPLQFAETGQRADFDPFAAPAVQGTNGIHWRNLDDSSNWLAAVWWWNVGGNPDQLWSTNMTFDSSRTWYDGTGDAPDGFLNQFCSLSPGCANDFWSVASHEWGHMTGFFGPFEGGHFNNSETICKSDPGPQHTMCPFIEIGTERLRTLEAHDIHTFETSY